MATAKLKELTLQQRICELEVEITSRTEDIQNLSEAIATLETNSPRPQSPAADNAFLLLKELVGDVPQRLENQRVYEGKLTAAKTSLRLASELCQERATQLKGLQQELRSQQADCLVQELLSTAEKFNTGIDEILDLFAQMQSLDGQIVQLRGGGGASSVLRIYAEMLEMPLCQIDGENVAILRRFDVR